MSDSGHGKYIVTEFTPPHVDPKFEALRSQFQRGILYLDDKVVPGAIQMSCVWYLKPMTESLIKAHQHEVPEIIGFFSSDHTKPYELGAEVEFWMENERFVLNKTCMIFVPAGMMHCPMIFRRVDRPVFHFSTLLQGTYSQQK